MTSTGSAATTPLSPTVRSAQRYATSLALIATLGPFFYGFEGMVLNGAISAVGTEFELGAFAKGLAGATGILGGLIGALFAGRLSDRIGRRTVLVLVGPCLLFEAILGAFSPWLGGFLFLLLCRIIGGIGFGAATTVAPGYVAEIAPAKIRGRLIAFRQLAIILGLFLAGVINVAVTSAAGASTTELALGLKAWQWMFLCLLIPAIFYIVFTARIPESPRWLVSRGRDEEAAAVLRRVTGDQRPEGRVAEIRRSLGESMEKLGILAILRSHWRGLVMVGVAIAAFQQLTGTNGIFFYSNTLFEAVGFSEDSALQQTLILTLFKIIGVTTGILLVDRVGRKRMLIAGGTLIFLSLAVVATVFTVAPVVDGVHDISGSPVLGFLAVAALCCFLLGFTSSWGPIFSIVMGEMFPNKIRGGAMSIASGADFFVNFMVVLLFPYLVAWSPAGTYWIYCAFGVLAVAFTARFLHETGGRQLEDMEEVAR
ncbi:sugar porter family MFS transporter [Brachybacterium sp. ACRRE]|uniref:sugar porter family MFS transporter n=1 Tax=Brachybacterium sp. ACRRE TaxID=2918184 RepID=UPI001EF25054|nr:sugar porter family MFS transporter [Brachybacterium sp. ACRRE]MCG7310070.1 sugar porter family MFS transporter [Brachybacterium sp. ACRRE]